MEPDELREIVLQKQLKRIRMEERHETHKIALRIYNSKRPTKRNRCELCGCPCSRRWCDDHRRLGKLDWDRQYRLKHIKHIKAYQKAYRDRKKKENEQ